MPQHKFKIGERLFLVRSIDPKMPQGAYQGAYLVIKRLPKRDDEFDYQIKVSTGTTPAPCAKVNCERHHSNRIHAASERGGRGPQYNIYTLAARLEKKRLRPAYIRP